MADQVEHFEPTSGRLMGWIGVVCAVAVGAASLFSLGQPWVPPVLVAAALAVVVLYAGMLRPRVSLSARYLTMRGMVDTTRVPLAAIEELAIRQVLAVRAGGRRYVSSAVGHSWRKLARTPASQVGGRHEVTEGIDPVDFIEERIRQALDEARRESGVKPWSAEADRLAEEIHRDRAWWLLGLMVGLALLLAGLIVF